LREGGGGPLEGDPLRRKTPGLRGEEALVYLFGRPSRRRDEWTPAVRGAGLQNRSPYPLRHTFASFAIAAGVPLFKLSRFMGTSVEQIGRAYGHLLPHSLERARKALDGFVGATESNVVIRGV